jgi:hypothetical protein
MGQSLLKINQNRLNKLNLLPNIVGWASLPALIYFTGQDDFSLLVQICLSESLRSGLMLGYAVAPPNLLFL